MDEHPIGSYSREQPPSRGPAPHARLLDIVLGSSVLPVFVTGGPARAPFSGPGPESWMNPVYALHHADSWESPFVLGAMLPLEAAAHPDSRAGGSFLSRYAGTMAELGSGPLPLVAQIWGPMTMAAMQAGLEPYLESLAGASAQAHTLTSEGLAATMAVAEEALRARPGVLWIAEPLAALADPVTLSDVWLPPMRQLVAASRAAGADPVLHVSGAASHTLAAAVQLGVSGVSITADTPLATTREALPDHVVVFGNLDSMRLLDRDEAWLSEQASLMADEMRGRPYVATPGSAIPGKVAVERLAAFVDSARGAE
jgi:uroporphyrinogen-III decarboxylase